MHHTKILCVTLLLCANLAHAAPAHVHGVANLELAVEGDQLTLDLDMPLDNTVGFEHPPRNDKEKAALAALMKLLQNGAELFVPAAAADCKLEKVKLEDAFPDGKAKADGHAEVGAFYVFRCTQPAALKAMETSLFRHFSRLQRVDAQRATPGGQGSARMTPDQPSLAW